MEIEAVKGAANRAEAESAFIRAVLETLPVSAFEEIGTLSRQHIVDWSARWNVNAPCIIKEAESWCDGGWSPDESGTVLTPSVPVEWFERLRQLNGLSIDASVLSWNPVDHVIGDGVRRAELGRLTKLGVSAAKSGYALELRNELPVLRDRLLSADVNLAPIGADPLRESEERFVERARNHFRGRVNVAKGMGFVEVAAKFHLIDHMDWLVAYQLRGETRANIAGRANVVRRAVDSAIRNLAAILRLSLRRDTGSRRQALGRK